MEKKFIWKFYGTVTIVLLLVMGIVIVMDPFYHYHDAIGSMKHVLRDRDYQVTGTLDHFSYDAILLGTSIAENNNVAQFRENFGLEVVKAIRAGGTNADFVYFLDRAYRHRELKRVFYFVDFGAMESEWKTTFDRMDTDYITNGNPFDDVKYVWNKDVLLKKIPLQIACSYVFTYDEDIPYSWYESKTFSQAAITGRYYPRDGFEREHVNEEVYQNFVANTEQIALRVKAHPETEFTFVFSPVSILWWDDVYRQGGLGQKQQELEKFVGELDSLPNVKIYDFQSNAEWTENLDHYMDTVHFSYEVNRELCDRIAQDEDRIHPENCREFLDLLQEMVVTFSHEDILRYYPDAVVR